jgi:hypothetical protein
MKFYNHARLGRHENSWYLDLPWEISRLAGLTKRPELHFWFRKSPSTGLEKYTADRFSLFISSFPPTVLNHLVYFETLLKSKPKTLAESLASLARKNVNIWESRSIDLGDLQGGRVELLCEATSAFIDSLPKTIEAEKEETEILEHLERKTDLLFVPDLKLYWKPSVLESARSISSLDDHAQYAPSPRSDCLPDTQDDLADLPTPSELETVRLWLPEKVRGQLDTPDESNYISLLFDSDTNTLKAISRNPAEVLLDLRIELVNEAGELRRVLQPLGECNIDFRIVEHVADQVKVDKDGRERTISTYLLSANIRDSKARFFASSSLETILYNEILWWDFREQQRESELLKETHFDQENIDQHLKADARERTIRRDLRRIHKNVLHKKTRAILELISSRASIFHPATSSRDEKPLKHFFLGKDGVEGQETVEDSSQFYRIIYWSESDTDLISLDWGVRRQSSPRQGDQRWYKLTGLELKEIADAAGSRSLALLDDHPTARKDPRIALACAVASFTESVSTFVYTKRLMEYERLLHGMSECPGSSALDNLIEAERAASAFGLLEEPREDPHADERLKERRKDEQWLGELYRDMQVGMTAQFRNPDALPFILHWLSKGQVRGSSHTDVAEASPHSNGEVAVLDPSTEDLGEAESQLDLGEQLAMRLEQLGRAVVALWAATEDGGRRKFKELKTSLSECLDSWSKLRNNTSTRADDFRNSLAADDTGADES